LMRLNCDMYTTNMSNQCNAVKKTIINFDNKQYQKAVHLARERCAPKVDYESCRVWGEDVYQDETVGVMGELAAGAYFGEDIMEWSSPTGDDGVDLWLGGTIGVDVKTGSKPGYRFALNQPDPGEFIADVGVMAWLVEEQSIELAGWTTKIHFFDNCQLMDFGYGPRLVLEPDKFLPMRLLLDLQHKMEGYI